MNKNLLGSAQIVKGVRSHWVKPGRNVCEEGDMCFV